jgi:3-oxoadipate enol-lactonase
MTEAAARPTSAPREHEVQTSMGRWSYTVHGERHRPLDSDILLLHALFLDSALWREQVGPLAKLGRVVALDLPGHGRSDVPPPFDLPGHAEALAAALPAMDVRRAVCVGLSWGGTLALHLALRRPACVAGLAVLSSSSEAQTRYRKAKFRLLLAIVRRFGLSPWLARTQIAPLMFSARSRRERPELVEEFVRSAVAVPREALMLAARAVTIDQPDILGRLGSLTIPALVLCGRDDVGYQRTVSERMARAIPGARLEWIAGAGHLSPLERPEEVNRLLVPFVAELLA